MFCRQFHQSLEITVPFTAISMLAIAFNIVGNQLWINGLNISIFGLVISFDGLGFVGSPLATSTSFVLQLALYYVWCFVHKQYHLTHKTWNGWSLTETILDKRRVWEFTKVVLPITLSNCSENWAYQVIVLFAATLDAAQIAAMSCSVRIQNSSDG